MSSGNLQKGVPSTDYAIDRRLFRPNRRSVVKIEPIPDTTYYCIENCCVCLRRAVYCLVGKCEPRDNHPDVAHKTDDYLWMKLCQLSHDDDYVAPVAPTSDRLTLAQLQTTLLEEHGTRRRRPPRAVCVVVSLITISDELSCRPPSCQSCRSALGFLSSPTWLSPSPPPATWLSLSLPSTPGCCVCLPLLLRCPPSAGESHFDAYQQPLLYAQVLLLSAQFEAALDFLSRMPALRAHAVHAALALYEAGCLLLPPSTNAALRESTITTTRRRSQ